MAVILSYSLVLMHGYAPFFIYFMYSAIGYSIIGIPCSIIADIIVLKIKGKTLGTLAGLSLHLIFAGIIVYLFTHGEPFKFDNILVYSVIVAAAGLWLSDSILKQVKFLR
ncbi:hypothetical protein [Paenibacillus phytorum]|uniref:hypothetical protein n=1 Tax=Paenibacillus phytorum TaxID=2654977 RepID=UPI001491B9BD|nr:hypothetical protein [Paenibacillus phytorum]